MHMKKLLILLFLAGFIVSCSPVMYIPDSIQTPSLTTKGETEVEGSFGTNGVDAGVAVAITDNIGVQIKGSFLRRNKDSGDYIFRNDFDGGAGYSRIITKNDVATLFFSAFLGGGYGKAEGENRYSEFSFWGSSASYTNYSKGKYFKAWGQPVFGVYSENLEFSASVRINYLEFLELENDFDSNPWGLDLEGLKHNVFIEPTMTLKAGSESVKFKIQVVYSQGYFPLNQVQFRNRMTNFNFGLCFNVKP